MYRLVVGMVVIQLLFPVRAMATDLSPYVGKSLQDKINGKTLFEVSDVSKNFQQVFGRDRYENLLIQLQGRISKVIDPELGTLIVSSECMHHDCPNNSVLIMKLDATMVGVCFSDLAPNDPNSVVIEWSGPGWNLKRTGNIPGCWIGEESPEEEVAAFKQARPR